MFHHVNICRGGRAICERLKMQIFDDLHARLVAICWASAGFSTSSKNNAGAPLALTWSIRAAICCAEADASELTPGTMAPITVKP